jgi:RNA polymerase sigma-70 factor (ECF subfamily)
MQPYADNPAEVDDIELMRRVTAHDQQAMRLMYQHYAKAIYSLAYHILQNSTLAEEVTQDSLLKVWENKAQWDPAKGTLKSWLLGVTHFTALDRLRREHRQPTVHSAPIEDIEEGSASQSTLHTDSLWQDEIVLRILLKQLPREHASLIDLAFFRGMSHSQIAESTRLPLGTVKTRLRSGLQQLRELWLESIRQSST